MRRRFYPSRKERKDKEESNIPVQTQTKPSNTISSSTNNSPTCILNVKSKFVHNIIKSFVPRFRLLRLSRHNKKLQNLCELTIEDYEIYHILKCNIGNNFSLSERPLDSALRTMKNIFELTKSELLFSDHSEINVPTPIYSLVQLNNDNRQIIAATEESLLVIEFSRKKNYFNIIKEIKIRLNGVFNTLIDLGNDMLLAGNLSQIVIINLDTEKIVFEFNGYCPITLRDKRICYIVNEEIMKIIKLNEIGYEEEIPLVHTGGGENEDTSDITLTSNGIQLRNGNVLLINWDRTITEYDLELKQCIQIIQTKINFMETCYELKDGRIAITATDNANFYLINRLSQRNDNYLKLCGHNNTVVKILQLENEQIISASCDGKVKIWYKLLDGNFNCAMTLLLFNDFIRTFLFMDDGRILITGDDKTLRALGVKNHIGNFKIKFIPEDKRTKQIKSFELIDNRIN